MRMNTGTGESNTVRSGPFWDGIEGRASIPPAAATLGLEFVSADVHNGTMKLAFNARQEWTNPLGNVLGAFHRRNAVRHLGPTLLATLAPDEFQSTLEISRRVA